MARRHANRVDKRTYDVIKMFFRLLYDAKHIDFMLPCVCSVKDHRKRYLCVNYNYYAQCTCILLPDRAKQQSPEEATCFI